MTATYCFESNVFVNVMTIPNGSYTGQQTDLSLPLYIYNFLSIHNRCTNKYTIVFFFTRATNWYKIAYYPGPTGEFTGPSVGHNYLRKNGTNLPIDALNRSPRDLSIGI